jgi:hypothetical protein
MEESITTVFSVPKEGATMNAEKDTLILCEWSKITISTSNQSSQESSLLGADIDFQNRHPNSSAAQMPRWKARNGHEAVLRQHALNGIGRSPKKQEPGGPKATVISRGWQAKTMHLTLAYSRTI